MQDLNSLSNSERMFLVEAAYGRAMLRAQGLERMLATLLICNLAAATSKRKGQAIEIAKVKRLPMGILIARFSLAFQPPKGLQDELALLLNFRNDLAHRISDTIIDSTVNLDWEGKVILELSEISIRFEDFHPRMRPFMESFEKQFGLNDEKITQVIREVYPGARVGA